MKLQFLFILFTIRILVAVLRKVKQLVICVFVICQRKVQQCRGFNLSLIMAQAQIDCCKSVSSCSNNTHFRESDKQIENQDGTVSSVPECAVCLQICVHPARLPCTHVFCYLCVKGVANQSKRCPMCRQEIPADFLERPQLVELIDQVEQKEAIAETDDSSHEEYQWFYEGRNGWWQYDPRTSLELETAYKQGKRSCELLIAGFLYIADFGSMLQLRRNDHSRRRHIKRDLYNVPKKGVAGLRLNNAPLREQEDQQQQQQHITREIRGSERSGSPSSDNIGDGTNTPIPPSNTPQTPAEGTASGDATPSAATRLLDHQRSDSLHQVLEQMRSLVSRENFSSNNQQDAQDIIDDGSFADQSLLPWLQQTPTNTYLSDDEHM
ncbi:PREDICTED: E3 ubiquitin-protein ligase rnf146 [Ceratosolen solmsi marchali]|uniref:E3 ubiquitin-protein ligase n=1 Tax=Ceratosolen solmsi marchali TaxID=326594 RepID=A0AAJ6YP10_9HYME|nr:PREDICTED: E3 ubiquitin-protein ligase rnf146 [Ceratosolen solmsi marchali]